MTRPKTKMTEKARLSAAKDSYKFAIGYFSSDKPEISASKEFLTSQAFEFLDQALGYAKKGDTIYPYILSAKAGILSELGRLDEANELIEKSVETVRLTREEEVEKAKIFYELATKFLKSQKSETGANKEFLIKQIFNYLDEGLNHSEKGDIVYPHIMAAKAQLLCEAGKFEEATEAFKDSIEAFEISKEKFDSDQYKVPYIHAYYALALFKNGNIPESEAQMDHAIESLPSETVMEKKLKKSFEAQQTKIKHTAKALEFKNQVDVLEDESASSASGSDDERSLSDADSGCGSDFSPKPVKKGGFSSLMKIFTNITKKGGYKLVHNFVDEDDGIVVSGEIGLEHNGTESMC